MPQDNSTNNDEIDLFGLFQTLWDGKWVISTFVAIAVLLASSFILFKEPLYESKISYSVDTHPPFYSKEKVLVDFKNKFYSKSVFEDWKKSNVDISLTYEDFSKNELVDGFLLAKENDDLLATLATENRGANNVIIIKSNQLSILDNFFEYANNINVLLKSEYVSRASDELNTLETRIKDFSATNQSIIGQNSIGNNFDVDRFIVEIEKGAEVIILQNPTKPIKISPKSPLILTLSIVFSGMVGFFFITARKAIRERKEKLTKA